jgi:hypothetical protein
MLRAFERDEGNFFVSRNKLFFSLFFFNKLLALEPWRDKFQGKEAKKRGEKTTAQNFLALARGKDDAKGKWRTGKLF